jgi:hypothetical protein
MLENLMGQGLFSLAELNHLRLEAMRLFEQCLTNGNGSALTNFIEQQLLHEPPRIQLLRDLADDLQQRLLSLREYHFDIRDRVVRTFSESYGVDITSLTPPDALDRYHRLSIEQVMSFVQENGVVLDEKDAILLRKMLDASIQMAAQLHNDIVLTTSLFSLVSDWLEGMSATIARRYWDNRHSDTPSENINH